MLIFKDLLAGDEIISDVYKLIDSEGTGGCLWEVDGAMVKPGQESFVLEGANASAEGEDADDGGDDSGDNAPILNLARDFRYQKIDPPSAKAYGGELKKYLKNVMNKMKETGKPAEEIEEFKKGAASTMKKLTAMHSDLDFYLGESAEADGEGNSMYVVVNFRDDGVTPYALIWKHGLSEMKV